jgi:glutamine synthetase
MATGPRGCVAGEGRFGSEQLQVVMMVNQFLRNKRAEWREYRHQITPFELDRYLPLL